MYLASVVRWMSLRRAAASLVRRNPTECGVSTRNCDGAASILRRPWPSSGPLAP